MHGQSAMQVDFIIPGDAVPKARARVTRWGTYTPKETVEFESRVRTIAQIQMKLGAPLQGALRVSVIITRGVPASWSKKKTQDALHGVIWPVSRPDMDNCIKSITDAMNGIVYVDDSQIVVMDGTKQFGLTAQTKVIIQTI